MCLQIDKKMIQQLNSVLWTVGFCFDNQEVVEKMNKIKGKKGRKNVLSEKVEHIQEVLKGICRRNCFGEEDQQVFLAFNQDVQFKTVIWYNGQCFKSMQ